MDKIAGVLLLAVLIFAWMFRYEVTFIGGGTNIRWHYSVLDRWTGSVTECRQLLGDYYGVGCPFFGYTDGFVEFGNPDQIE